MMKIDIVTIFPEMVEAGLAPGVIGRARQAGLLDIVVHNLRDFTTDRHRVVDDVPFGGGPGMVLKPEPLFVAVDAITDRRGRPDAVVLMSPAGRRFEQADARRLAKLRHVVLLCGRYEGIDERVHEHVATEELSIGDYVLSGGELPALVVVDAVCRLVPGVVGDEGSVDADSFTRGLLDYPHYTRPAEYRGHRVPDVLTSGHHAEIRNWRRREALRRTRARRPELLATAALDVDERELLINESGPTGPQKEGAATAAPKKGSD
jgi:tRNA (guanine37-N1)-methyltransferase